MPICITGMHRSGTSLVAQLLSVCGVDLGPEEEFVPANEFNADGYWENTRFTELADAVLETLGGGWDSPPEWADVDGLATVRAAAARAIDELGLSEPWGWKDPRASVTLPFWVDLLPDLQVVVCVRHPFEVARSLHRRGAVSPQLALSLWRTYNERLLADAGPDRRVVTHYRAYLADARAELARVTRALALDVTRDVLDEAASRVKAGLRHHESAAGDPPLPADVLALYETLCAEAEVEPEPRRRGARKRPAVAPLSHELAADAWRSHLEGLRQNRDEWQQAAERSTAELAELRSSLEQLEQERAEFHGRAEELEREHELLRTHTAELEDERARWEREAGREAGDREHWERHAARISALSASLRARGDGLELRVAELERERDALAGREAALEVEIRRRRSDHDALSAQHARLQAHAGQLEADAAQLRDERAALQAQHAELEAAAAASEAELGLLRASRRELLRRAGDLEAERDSIAAAASELGGANDKLARRATELEAALATMAARATELEAALAATAARATELEAAHDTVAARATELEAAFETMVARAGELETARDRIAARARELEADLREARTARGVLEREEAHRRERIDALTGELAVRRRDLAEADQERVAYAEDRDRWQQRALELEGDRDRWQRHAAEQERQAAAWRATAEELEARRGLRALLRRVGHAVVWLPALLWAWVRHPRTSWQRLRLKLWRKAFPHLQRAWWALPRRTRDFLRPIIFKDARARPAVRAYAPPRMRPLPSARGAGTGVNREIPRHRRAEQPPVAVNGPLPPVSVLIPTLNGGPVFAQAIAEIRRQEGLGDLEIVVVDSGSSDETTEIARQARAKVIEIPQSEFGHGRTRNLLAESASGDVLLMLVQDAVPLTRHVFRHLVETLLEDERAAAAWARQVPRSDADLYGAFVVYSHDRVTAEERARALTKKPERQTPEERRALAGLDDVCAALRREAWEELRFGDVGFAEDLDFGLRAVEAGWTIRHAPSAAVAHSHTRNATYHLRRSVADRLYVAERLGDDRLSRAAGSGPASVAAAAVTIASELEGAVRRVPVHLEPQATLDSWLQALGRMLERKPPRMEPTGELALLSEVLRAANGEVRLDPPEDELRQELLALLSWPPLREFGRAQLTPDPVAVADLVAKLAASALGRALGDALRHSGDSERARELMSGV